MKYYIDTIEQTVKRDDDDKITELNEYGKREVVGRVENETDEEYRARTLSKYYKKLSDVSADLDKNHTYMLIQVIDSKGGALKGEEIGVYLYAIPQPEPQPEPEPEPENEEG